MTRRAALSTLIASGLAWTIAISSAWAGVVTNANDSGAGSLRAVLAGAAGSETITFALPPSSAINLASELPITQSVTIEGPGALQLSIFNASGRIFNLNTAAKDVLISGLLLSGQNPSGDGGAIINNGGNLTLQYVTIQGSTSPGEGGAIRNNFNGNTGYALTIQNSTISGNSANKSGGVYFLGFPLTIENSTIYNNHATDSSGGLGLFGGGGFIRNSTIAGNTANTVAGITAQSFDITFESTIVSNNIDPSGINDLNRTGNGTINSINSLFSEAFVPADNVLNGTVTNTQVGAQPLLEGFTFNGGPTQTLRPGAGSPAIGAGVNLHSYVWDQRGPVFRRDAAESGLPAVDIGAIQRLTLVLVPAPAIPTLQPWMLVLLAALLGVVALRRVRRR